MSTQDPIAALAKYLQEHAEDTVSLEDMSRFTGYSAFHLQRRFKTTFGLSPKQFHGQCRKEKLKQNLRADDSVTSALYSAGYGSASRVYEKAVETLGMTPRQYRKKGEGLSISYVLFSTSLGWILIAATAKGLCAVELDDRREVLKLRLAQEFPAAALSETQAPFIGPLADWESALRGYLEGKPISSHLPFDIQATAFQARVWKFLLTIPSGETRSYAEVAQALEHPKAARAVARACSANPVALAIPCHRVIRGDGHLGGYRWGLLRKEAILRAEKLASANAAG